MLRVYTSQGQSMINLDSDLKEKHIVDSYNLSSFLKLEEELIIEGRSFPMNEVYEVKHEPNPISIDKFPECTKCNYKKDCSSVAIAAAVLSRVDSLIKAGIFDSDNPLARSGQRDLEMCLIGLKHLSEDQIKGVHRAPK